jgi:hypothetical protein
VLTEAGSYLGNPGVTGEHEIELGLRKRPMREPFLAMKVSLRELLPAVRMPGKALAVWLLIRYRVDLNKGRPATLPQRVLSDWGIGRNAKVDALRRLEQAGLIKVERPKGYMLKVKLAPRRRRGRDGIRV